MKLPSRKLLHLSIALLFASLVVDPVQSWCQQRSSVKGATSAKKIDVCTLLTSAEVGAVQGEAVTEAKVSPERTGGLVMSQCLFKTGTPAKSVSVALALPSPTKTSVLSPRQFWRQQFQSGNAEKKESESNKRAKKSDREDHEESSEPRSISGLGDQAYWMANPIAGALYVLRGDRFVRISVGGVPKQSERLEKSIKLARYVLARLP